MIRVLVLLALSPIWLVALIVTPASSLALWAIGEIDNILSATKKKNPGYFKHIETGKILYFDDATCGFCRKHGYTKLDRTPDVDEVSCTLF